MNTLNQQEAAAFLERFYSFTDAVLRKVEIAYANDGGRTVKVWVATRDAKAMANDGWVCVRLVVSRVQDFCFADTANTTAAVITNGIHLCWFSGSVGLDFGHFVDPPEDLIELKSSRLFVIGTLASWIVEAY